MSDDNSASASSRTPAYNKFDESGHINPYELAIYLDNKPNASVAAQASTDSSQDDELEDPIMALIGPNLRCAPGITVSLVKNVHAKWEEKRSRKSTKVKSALRKLAKVKEDSFVDYFFRTVLLPEYEKANRILERATQLPYGRATANIDASHQGIIILPPSIGETFITTYNFNLQHNELTAIPPQIGRLQNLTELNLSFNHIRVLPEEIGDLGKTLRKLVLNNNDLEELPQRIGELVDLQELDLAANHLRSLPATIVSIHPLKSHEFKSNCLKLDLTYNPIYEISPEIHEWFSHIWFDHLKGINTQFLQVVDGAGERETEAVTESPKNPKLGGKAESSDD